MQKVTGVLKRGRESLFLREMGFVLLAGGTAHLVAVNILYLTKSFPEHDRIGYIYFIGAIQLIAGAIDILAYRAIRSDKKLARHLVLLSALAITAYVLIILPTYPEFSPLFKLAPAIYLLYHWWAVLWFKRISKWHKPLAPL